MAGKSTLARRLAGERGLDVVSFDAINAERDLPFGGEGMPETVWERTLEIGERRVRDRLEEGRHVVVDDTLCYRWLRDRFRTLAAASGARAELLWLPALLDVLEARRQLLLASGARNVLSAAMLAAHVASFEPPAADEPHVTILTPADADRWLAGLVF